MCTHSSAEIGPHMYKCAQCAAYTPVCVSYVCVVCTYVSGYMGICASIIHTAFAQFLVGHIAHCELQFIMKYSIFYTVDKGL